MPLSRITPNGVLTTTSRFVFSIASVRGSPPYSNSTAFCSMNTILGASFLSPSVVPRSASAEARLAVSRSSDIRNPSDGKSASTISVNRCCRSGVASG
ncbi:MAG: hypothetical protein ACREMV_09765 [Gemmatimonadales bacterium]